MPEYRATLTPMVSVARYNRMKVCTMRTLIGRPVAARRKTVTPAVESAIIASLRSHNTNYRQARQQRINAIIDARAVGFTNQKIGDVLGITETAVRQTIRKAAGGK